MCGLLGYSGTHSVDQSNLRLLFLCNMERGSDSTGVCGNQSFKMVSPAKEFLKQPGFLTATTNAKTVVGHTRKKSSGGAISKDTAHPFKIGKGVDALYGAHNGTIQAHYLTKASKYFKEEEPSLDSLFIYEMLYKHRNKKGEIEFNKVLPYIYGTMALVFKYRDSLYFYRRDGNHERPLHVGLTRDRNGLYVSSEKEPLQMLGLLDVQEVPPNVVYKVHNGIITSKINVEAATHDKIPYTPTAPVTRGPVHNHHGANIGFNYNGREATKAGTHVKQIAMFSDKYSNSEASDAGAREFEVTRFWRNAIDECMAIHTNIPVDFSKLGSSENAYSSSSYVLINVATQYNNNNYALKNFMCFVEIPELKEKDEKLHKELAAPFAVTDSNGLCAMEFPASTFLKLEGKDSINIRLYCWEPVYGEQYFTGDIKLTAGRVLEVALNIPFRYSGLEHNQRFQRFIEYQKLFGEVLPSDKTSDTSRQEDVGYSKTKQVFPSTDWEEDELPDGLQHVRNQDNDSSELSILEPSRVLEGGDPGNSGKDSARNLVKKIREVNSFIAAKDYRDYIVDNYYIMLETIKQHKLWEADGWVSEERWIEELPSVVGMSTREMELELIENLSKHKEFKNVDLKDTNLDMTSLLLDCYRLMLFYKQAVYEYPLGKSLRILTYPHFISLYKKDIDEQELNKLTAGWASEHSNIPDVSDTAEIGGIPVEYYHKYPLIMCISGGLKDITYDTREVNLAEFSSNYVLDAIETTTNLINNITNKTKLKALNTIHSYLVQLELDIKSFGSHEVLRLRNDILSSEKATLIKLIGYISNIIIKGLNMTPIGKSYSDAINLRIFLESTYDLLLDYEEQLKQNILA